MSKETYKSKEEIEAEVQARVNFKLDELVIGMRNTATRNWQIAFQSGNPKYSHYWEAFEQMVQMLEKERTMPPPYDEMALQKKREAKDFAVQSIMSSLTRYIRPGSENRHVIRNIVSAIETAQKY